MKKLLLFVFCFNLLVIVKANTHYKGEPTISGVVTDATTKKPLADVSITATHTTTKTVHQISTNENGSFKIPVLPTGTYKFKFEKENYKAVEKNNVKVKTETATKLNVEIFNNEDVTEEELVWQLKFGLR
ncbi:MAG: hypothetical protein AMXMBFR79_09120 [Chitinophagaceae bacterium]